MKKSDTIPERILKQEEIAAQAKRWRLKSKTIAFTHGVFDILDEGHLTVLAKAASFADTLVVGVNSDTSAKKLNGESSPINKESSRALLLASLFMVDAVVIFDEETPLELIKIIEPDVLVKGGNDTMENIVGAKEVIANNGKVEIIPPEDGFFTTAIIEKIKNG